MRGRESMPMFDIPEEIDEIKIKKDINDFMRKIQEETNQKNVFFVEKNRLVFVILILYLKWCSRILPKQVNYIMQIS